MVDLLKTFSVSLEDQLLPNGNKEIIIHNYYKKWVCVVGVVKKSKLYNFYYYYYGCGQTPLMFLERKYISRVNTPNQFGIWTDQNAHECKIRVKK